MKSTLLAKYLSVLYSIVNYIYIVEQQIPNLVIFYHWNSISIGQQLPIYNPWQLAF